jgi:hypothetical protein
VSDTQTRLDAAEREVESQMGAKLEAQQALMVIVGALDLKLSDLGNGWKEATPPILARIDTIVDEAERGFSERDSLAAELERVTAALRVFADDLSWEVTPQYQTDGRYRFNCPPESVYATPWGFARAALAGGARAQEDK